MIESSEKMIEEELAKAGTDPELIAKLKRDRITVDKELPPMEFLLKLFDVPCCPRGELVAFTGKAKSGKTFVMSMMMAAAAASKVLAFHRTTFEPLQVLWIDTEQSDQSTQDILKNRLVPMVTGAATPPESGGDGGGLNERTFRPPQAPPDSGGEDNTTFPDHLYDIFNVRSMGWKERRRLLLEAVKRYDPDLVIVDGIRDLVNDINDGVLAQDVMEELMQMAALKNCCIVCVLHQNKGSEDHNLRGWIGTELMNKAFEVYSCEKLLPQRIFKLEQTLTRKYDIEQAMYFEVNGEGLPQLSMGPTDSISQANGERLPSINSEYILHDDDGSWRFDVMKLFLAAFQGKCELQGYALRERVMQLSGIVIPFKYNQLLHQALEQKVIEKMQRDGLTVYQPAPF